MPARSILAKLVVTAFLVVAASVSTPLCAQTIRHPRPHWAVPRAPVDPRPVFAGALIGGVLAALSAPMYYDAPYVASPDARAPQRDAYGSSGSSVDRAASIADRWQQFGEPLRDERAQSSAGSSRFVESWQRFFEPSQ